jgi:hypothetical protein
MHREEVLLANEAFYLAFAEKDLAAMDRVWADRPDVVCVHPGWPALTDRRTVMESWARILGNPEQPAPAMHVTDLVDLGGAVLVVCYERVADAVMVASNLFAAGPSGPRLVAHHAGPCGAPPELPPLTVPSLNG